jgi:hypothetical protein
MVYPDSLYSTVPVVFAAAVYVYAVSLLGFL